MRETFREGNRRHIGKTNGLWQKLRIPNITGCIKVNSKAYNECVYRLITPRTEIHQSPPVMEYVRLSAGTRPLGETPTLCSDTGQG